MNTWIWILIIFYPIVGAVTAVFSALIEEKYLTIGGLIFFTVGGMIVGYVLPFVLGIKMLFRCIVNSKILNKVIINIK